MNLPDAGLAPLVGGICVTGQCTVDVQFRLGVVQAGSFPLLCEYRSGALTMCLLRRRGVAANNVRPRRSQTNERRSLFQGRRFFCWSNRASYHASEGGPIFPDPWIKFFFSLADVVRNGEMLRNSMNSASSVRRTTLSVTLEADEFMRLQTQLCRANRFHRIDSLNAQRLHRRDRAQDSPGFQSRGQRQRSSPVPDLFVFVHQTGDLSLTNHLHSLDAIAFGDSTFFQIVA